MDEQQIRRDFLTSLAQYNRNLSQRLQQPPLSDQLEQLSANSSGALSNFSLSALFPADWNATNGTAMPPASSYPSWWVDSLRWVQGVLTTLGMVGNFLVILTLLRRRYQSKFASAVFLHQTVMDFMVCVVTLILLVKPAQNPTNNVSIGFLLCHVIASQLLYWYFVFSSVQNLILIAIDRFFAVFKPVKYKTLGYRSAVVHMLALHGYSLIVNIIDVFSVEFDAENNLCSTEITSQVFKKAFRVYGFVWFFLVYLVPVAAVVCLYAIIIYRLGDRGMQTSRFRQRAATELTKSAVIITGIFIVCFSYDCIYYLLGHLDLVQYVYNSPTQLIGVALVTLNSCTNPVVYCIIMQSFRQRMMSAVFCCCAKLRCPCDPGDSAGDDGCGAANRGAAAARRGRLSDEDDDEEEEDELADKAAAVLAASAAATATGSAAAVTAITAEVHSLEMQNGGFLLANRKSVRSNGAA